MSQPLYWSIEKFSLRYAYFVFFDTVPYLADQLFIRHRVRVWFDREYAKKDSPYIAVLCHVRKKDVPQFLDALEDLKKSMLLCGHPDYVTEIRSLMETICSGRKELRNNINFTPMAKRSKRAACRFFC